MVTGPANTRKFGKFVRERFTYRLQSSVFLLVGHVKFCFHSTGAFALGSFSQGNREFPQDGGNVGQGFTFTTTQ